MQKKFKLFARISVLALLFYSWLGFLVIPAAGLNLINQKLAEFSTEPARLARLEFNPFTLQLDAWHLQIGHDSDTLAFSSLHARLSWSSIWQRKLHLHSFQIKEPNLRLEINQLGELNLLKLFRLPEPEPQQQPVPEPEDPLAPALPALQIDKIIIADGRASFTDQRPAGQVTIDFNELNLELDNLNTTPDEQGLLQLGLQIPDGTSINWHGDLFLNPVSSAGQLSIANLPLKTWWPYARAFTDLELEDGRLAVSSAYNFSLATATPQLQLEDFRFSLEQLALSHHDQPMLALAQLRITDTTLDLQQQQLNIGKIHSSGLDTGLYIDQQGRINWLAAIKQSTAETGASAQEADSSDVAQEFAGTGLAALDWQIVLQQLELADYQLALEDLSRADPVQVRLSGFGLSLENFDSYSEQAFDLRLDSSIGAQGKLALLASINPQSLASTVQLSTDNLDLRPAQAWLSPYAHARLLGAMLNSELQLQLPSIAPLQLELAGKLAISQLHVQDKAAQRDLLKWHNLSLDGIHLQQAATTALSIEQITFNQPYVRLIIDEELQTNIGQVLIAQPESEQSAQPDSAPPKLHLGKIRIIDGSAHFADLSLTPSFATAMHDLNGEIGTLDNQGQQATPLRIEGAVDRQAPVLISGQLTPFDPLHQLEVTTSFKHMELTTLTPYSGKFVGYRINKGKLHLDLHYQIEQGQLNASNSVLLEQLELGQRVDSKDAVQLPVRLAVALLKDNRGNIDIQLPVQGNLNNPEFSVMPIVWQTLRNLITRAVSAPFKMLGSLVNSQQDLDHVGFAPGSSELDDNSQQRLLTLATALQQRPLLKLNIEAGSSVAFDGIAVAEKYLELRIRQLRYAELQERGRTLPENVLDVEVSARQYNNLLQQLYEQLPAEQQAPELTGNREEQRALMRQQLLQAYALNETRMRLLAQRRAQSIRDFLIEHGGLQQERIFLLDVNEKAVSDGEVINSLLHLDA